MALTTYLTVNGTIYSQKKSGARTHFIHDALGSIAATINDGGSVVNKYTYKPYGELLSKTGVGEDPRFLWVGGAGYQTTGRRWAEKYVRRRHYGEQQGMWTTVDPLWPTESAFNYVRGNPIGYIDPSGLAACAEMASKKCCCCPKAIKIVKGQIIDGSSRVGESGNRWGHYFEIEIELEYVEISESQRASECYIVWCEASNAGVRFGESSQRSTPGEWIDQRRRSPKSKYWKPWDTRSKPCPGTSNIAIIDEPSIEKSVMISSALNMTAKRELFIELRLGSSSGCPCPNSELRLRIYQQLTYQSAKANDPKGPFGSFLGCNPPTANCPAIPTTVSWPKKGGDCK